VGKDSHLIGKRNIGYARQPHPTVCDSNLLKKWYNSCVWEHGDNCPSLRIVGQNSLGISQLGGSRDSVETQSLRLPEAFHVIDVVEWNIVPAPEDCDFVALSYVCGRSMDDIKTLQVSVESRKMKNSLKKLALPKTIIDSIHLTQELEERYLWVDALCIVQDSPQSMNQTKQTDLIYGLSKLVIVAASGKDANAGLMGYKDTPRTTPFPYYEQKVGDLRLAVSSPTLATILSSSTWWSRGWTCQEWLMSRRMLVFTEHQVYYLCSAVSQCEDLCLDKAPHFTGGLYSEMDSAIARRGPSTDRHHQPGCFRPWTRMPIDPPVDYSDLVKMSATRMFTHDVDVLNARILSAINRSEVRNRILRLWLRTHKLRRLALLDATR
jgi:hypothetical protein